MSEQLKSAPVDGADVHVLPVAPAQPSSGNPLNPYGINFIPEFTKIVLHRSDPKETTRAGIVIPKHLQEAHAKEQAQNQESVPLYVLAVSKQIQETTGIRPGQWVYLDADASGQFSSISGKKLVIANGYDVIGRAVYYQDDSVESLYSPMSVEEDHARSL